MHSREKIKKWAMKIIQGKSLFIPAKDRNASRAAANGPVNVYQKNPADFLFLEIFKQILVVGLQIGVAFVPVEIVALGGFGDYTQVIIHILFELS